MAEPIDPHGPETSTPPPAGTPESKPAPAADSDESPRSSGQVDTELGTADGDSGSLPVDSKRSGEIVPTDSQPPATRPATEPEPASTVKQPLPADSLAKTRAAAAWLATGAALIILALIIVLILQNQETVEVNYLWFGGSLPLGTALLIAAVAGAAIVMIVGTIRLTQVRRNTRRAQKAATAQRPGSAKKD